MPLDTIIRNCRWFRDGRISAITPKELEASSCPQVIDTTGKWVLPGLLDIHTHYDVEVLDGPALSESLRQGVTTVMVGSFSLSTMHVDGVNAGDLFGRVETPQEHTTVPTRVRPGRKP